MGKKITRRSYGELRVAAHSLVPGIYTCEPKAVQRHRSTPGFKEGQLLRPGMGKIGAGIMVIGAGQ